MKVFVVAFAVALLAAGGAAAQTDQDDDTGTPWYVALGYGHHWPGTVNSHSTLDAPDGQPYNWLWKTENGWALSGAIGYRFTAHLRAELETGFYYSRLVSVHAPGANVGGFAASRPGEPYGLCDASSVLPSCIPVGQQEGSLTWMWTGFLNGIYDILPYGRVDPFVGAGVGLAHVEWTGQADPPHYLYSGVPGPISATNPAEQYFKGAGTLFLNPGQFAVQFLGGVSFQIMPRVHLDFTYYHYLTPGLLRWNPLNMTPGLPHGAGLQPGDFVGRFQDDSVIASVRYAF